MEKFNKKFGISLVISCVLSCMAIYFDIAAIPSLMVSFGLATVITIIAMCETYEYQEVFEDYNPCKFWIRFPIFGGAILVALFYAIGLKLVADTISLPLILGLSPLTLPTIGIFLGDAGRILFLDKPSAM